MTWWRLCTYFSWIIDTETSRYWSSGVSTADVSSWTKKYCGGTRGVSVLCKVDYLMFQKSIDPFGFKIEGNHPLCKLPYTSGIPPQSPCTPLQIDISRDTLGKVGEPRE